MYVLVHKNRILVGPRDWNYGMFEGALEKIGINMYLPRREPDNLPLIIDEDTRITNSVLTMPPYNEKIERTHGPYWDTSTDPVTGTYGIATLEIEFIKPKLKNLVAVERYNKEISGFKIIVQNKEVTVDTNRGSRDIFIQKYFLMNDNQTVKWKFPETWLELSKTELGLIVIAGAEYIQRCFDWEESKNQEIDQAQTAQELDAIQIYEETPL